MLPTNRDAAGFSADEIQEYFEIGWTIRRAVFRSDEVARMRTCFDELEEIASGLNDTALHAGSYFVLGRRDDVKVIQRVVWAGACQRYLLDVGNDPRLKIPCAQLLQSDKMEHLINQAHFKRPRDGIRFDWHQDIQHRDKGNGTWADVNGLGSYVQTVIVLDEMTPDNGPILFVPGSSKWGRVDFGNPDDYCLRETETLMRSCKESAVTILAGPGDVVFFGPYTLHASFENTSDLYRRVLINGYASPGANHRVYPGDGAGRMLSVPTGLPIAKSVSALNPHSEAPR